eukprot:1391562-Amorphochlora_amoeboformis.AAC.2
MAGRDVLAEVCCAFYGRVCRSQMAGSRVWGSGRWEKRAIELLWGYWDITVRNTFCQPTLQVESVYILTSTVSTMSNPSSPMHTSTRPVCIFPQTASPWSMNDTCMPSAVRGGKNGFSGVVVDWGACSELVKGVSNAE